MAAAGLLVSGGCWFGGGNEVAVYTAVDARISEPVLNEFADDTAIKVIARFNAESAKTPGLADAIIAERSSPHCDVFWDNEVMNTLRLAEMGLLETYQPPLANEYPPLHQSIDATWHGFAARARVLLVNARLVPAAEHPKSINDLVDPKWKGRVAIANPLLGTSATHAACLFSVWGNDKSKQFFQALNDNAHVLRGNREVAKSVSAGQSAFGLTDADDAVIELDKGAEVTIVYPDQEADGLGTLFIPNTLAIVKGCPHPIQARTLVDFLLTPSIEEQLAKSPRPQIPLHVDATGTQRLPLPANVLAMQVDFAAAARQWKNVAALLTAEFGEGK